MKRWILRITGIESRISSAVAVERSRWNREIERSRLETSERCANAVESFIPTTENVPSEEYSIGYKSAVRDIAEMVRAWGSSTLNAYGEMRPDDPRISGFQKWKQNYDR